MRTRPLPQLHEFMKEKYARDSRLQLAVRAQAGEAVPHAPDLREFSLEQRKYIEYMGGLLKRGPFDQTEYMKAFGETAQVAAMPEITNRTADLYAMLFQPELLDAFADWTLPRGRRGGEANTIWAKALMSLLATSSGTHVKSVDLSLREQPRTQALFAHLEQEIASRSGQALRPFTPRAYETALDQIMLLSARASTDGFARRLMQANIALVQSMSDLHPNAGIGEYLAIDGTDIAAWCQQNRDGSTARTPKAGLKMIEYGKGGKRDITDGAPNVSPIYAKIWKGYYLVVLVDIRTGLPLVWTLRNARYDEAQALKELLFLLFELWPDCPAQTLVGDGAWDERQWVEYCELNYGIHPIFRRGETRANAEHLLSHKQSKLLAGYDGRGIVRCREHDAELTYRGGTYGDRSGLPKGEPSNSSDFRVRFDCEHGCGRPSLAVATDWTAFSYYPHHSNGLAKRHALRLALEARRNICESVFSSLKTVSQLGLRGAARTRLTDYDTVHTLISLSFTLRSSLLVADQRAQAGLFDLALPAAIESGSTLDDADVDIADTALAA
jgi:hypothetical protein